MNKQKYLWDYYNFIFSIYIFFYTYSKFNTLKENLLYELFKNMWDIEIWILNF